MSYARQEGRSPCDCLALVRPTTGEAEVVRVTDLSLHGVGVRGYTPLEEGEKVTVILETAPPTALDAEVVWSRPDYGDDGRTMQRAGMRLTTRSEAQMTRLRSILGALQRDSPTIPLRLPFAIPANAR